MIKVVPYESLEDCMLACFYEFDTMDELLNGRWEWYDQDNDRNRVWSMRRVLRNRRKIGTWGFCHNKKEIHIWISDHATPKSILKLIAHEIGHMQRPFKKKSILEEKKAMVYADVALTAFEIMEKLINDKKSNKCI